MEDCTKIPSKLDTSDLSHNLENCSLSKKNNNSLNSPRDINGNASCSQKSKQILTTTLAPNMDFNPLLDMDTKEAFTEKMVTPSQNVQTEEEDTTNLASTPEPTVYEENDIQVSSKSTCDEKKKEISTSISTAPVMRKSDYVILQDTVNNQKIVQICPKHSVYFGSKIPFSLKNLINKPFGTTFRYEKGAWNIHHTHEETRLQTRSNSNEPNTVPDVLLYDDNSSQNLTPAQIASMRRALSSDELIDKIVENSSSFMNKTTFSQEKYIKKKRLKHIQEIRTIQPTLMNICDTYYRMNPKKICGLRFDYLGAILTYADVCPHRRFLLFDQSSGLLTAAIALHLNGSGKIYRLTQDNMLSRIVEKLDLPTNAHNDFKDIQFSYATSQLQYYQLDNTTDIITHDDQEQDQNHNQASSKSYKRTYDQAFIPLNNPNSHANSQQINNTTNKSSTLRHQQQSTEEKLFSQDNSQVINQHHNNTHSTDQTTSHAHSFVKPTEISPVDMTEASTKGTNTNAVENNEHLPSQHTIDILHKTNNLNEYSNHNSSKPNKWYYSRKFYKELQDEGVHTFVGVFAPYKPNEPQNDNKPIIYDCLNIAHKNLRLDGRLIMYCTDFQPLSDCHAILTASSEYVHVQLEEIMLREHQILPNRTHPLMDGNSRLFEGYILSAIKVEK